MGSFCAAPQVSAIAARATMPDMVERPISPFSMAISPPWSPEEVEQIHLDPRPSQDTKPEGSSRLPRARGLDPAA